MGDYDGDGDLDAVSAFAGKDEWDSAKSQIVLHTNIGTVGGEVKWTHEGLATDLEYVHGAIFADVDAGRAGLEIVTASWGDNRVSVWKR